MSKTIKTFVLALNDAGQRELLTFDIPVEGLDLRDAQNHVVAIRMARAMPGKCFAPNSYVAFDETDPAAKAFMSLPIAKVQVPRVVITIEGGLVESCESDQPVEVLVIDRDTEGADAENLFHIQESRDSDEENEFYVHRFSVPAHEADNCAEWIASVFEAIDRQERERESSSKHSTPGRG